MKRKLSKNLSDFAVLCVAGAVASLSPAHAQSGAEANAWAAWCREQGGQVVVTSSNPYCAPPSGGGSGGYTASEQAMLDLAGQVGNALGAAIRQSFQESARQAEIARMQRAWEAEQARQRAAQALEEQRLRNQALLANMQGVIGEIELSQRGVGSGELHLRTTEEMFDASSPSTTTNTPAADADAAWDAYLAALQSHGAAKAALEARQAALAVGNRIANAAARDVLEQRARVEAAAAGSEERRLEEAKLVDAEVRLAEALRLRDQAQSEVDSARADASRASEALAAADAQRTAASGDLSVQDAIAASSPSPHTDTSVVDLRAPGVAVVDPAYTDFSVVDARGPIGEQYANLPRLEEVEDSPGRSAWLRGMDAIANRDYELAVDWFEIAQQNDPSNPALARAIDGASFVRDRLRLRTAETSGAAPAPSAPVPTGQVVEPTEADLEFLREDMTEQAQRMWASLTPDETRRLRALDLEDQTYRQLLFEMMTDGR